MIAEQPWCHTPNCPYPHTKAKPLTLDTRGVAEPSRYVLEVNAGFSDRHGVTGGDTVTFAGVPGTPP